jgi:hypothetical protein
MRKTVKSYRKHGYCRKVIKGSRSDHGKLNGSLAVDQPLEIFKGKPCLTDFRDKAKNPQNKRRSAWRGQTQKSNRDNRDSDQS